MRETILLLLTATFCALLLTYAAPAAPPAAAHPAAHA